MTDLFGGKLNTWLNNGLPIHHGGKAKGPERAALDVLGGPEGFRKRHVLLADGVQMTVRTMGEMPPRVTYTRPETLPTPELSWPGTAHYSPLILAPNVAVSGMKQKPLLRVENFFSVDNIVDVWAYDSVAKTFSFSKFAYYDEDSGDAFLYPPYPYSEGMQPACFPAALVDGKVGIGSPWHGTIHRESAQFYRVGGEMVEARHPIEEEESFAELNSYRILRRDTHVLNLSGEMPAPSAGQRNYALLAAEGAINSASPTLDYPYGISLAGWPYIGPDGTRFALTASSQGGDSLYNEAPVGEPFTVRVAIYAEPMTPVGDGPARPSTRIGIFDLVGQGLPFGGSAWRTFSVQFSPSGKKAVLVAMFSWSPPSLGYVAERFWSRIYAVCGAVELTFSGGTAKSYPKAVAAPVAGIVNHAESEDPQSPNPVGVRDESEVTNEQAANSWTDGDGAEWERIVFTTTHNMSFVPDPPVSSALIHRSGYEQTKRVGYGADDTLNVLRVRYGETRKYSADAGSGWSASASVSWEMISKNNQVRELNVLNTADGSTSSTGGETNALYETSIEILCNGASVFSLHETGQTSSSNPNAPARTVSWETMSYDPSLGIWSEFDPHNQPYVRFSIGSQPPKAQVHSGRYFIPGADSGCNNAVCATLDWYLGDSGGSLGATALLVGIDGRSMESSMEEYENAYYEVLEKNYVWDYITTAYTGRWCCYDPVEHQFTMTPFERFV
ncbi:MAG: hypothetical protein LBO20_03130 [Bifidobacteriaceae bacterium]|jgi:hypothetical protein|nr:hypothetical protein [Bifidobacteriaceae bacterium]